MPSFTSSAIAAALRAGTATMAQHQRADGAYINPDWGLDDPSHCGTGLLVAACIHTGMTDRALRGIEYLLRYQRPSGLLDMRSCNFDSAPDTAFTVQLLATVLPETDGDLRAQLTTFLRRTFPGLMTGGFHTPNHRWVVAAALAQLAALFPDPDPQPTLNAYLAEDVDQDADGCYLERSPAVYDAVTNRSLLLLADHAGFAAARAAVARNLDFNLHLLHADATIETGLSRRQDRAWRKVPLSLAANYLATGNATAARHLWEQTATPSLTDLFWLAVGRDATPSRSSPCPLPDNFSRHFPAVGLWRTRRGSFSASIFRDTPHLLHLVAGNAELVSLTSNHAYFGVGQFIADTLTVTGNTAVLRSAGSRHPRRPGYEQPLGAHVPADQWDAALQRRQLRPIPPATTELELREIPDGFACRYRNLTGMDRVPVQLAFDFAPGGEWNGRSTVAGEEIFLTGNSGQMRYGDSVIEIGPGSDAHRMRQMRDSAPAPHLVRVIIPLLTPASHSFSIRTRHG